MSTSTKSPFASPLTHYHFADPQNIRRTELSGVCRRAIKRKEGYLGKTCRRLWVANNWLGEDFIFGSFCSNRKSIIVTVAAYIPGGGGWITQH